MRTVTQNAALEVAYIAVHLLEILQNEFPGSTLAQFKGEVSSSDCQLTYAIWNGTKYVNETALFKIDTVTGELKAKESFDCEERDRHAVRGFAVR